MKCVVGLGNPGAKYALTKHNIGFLVLDKLSQKLGLEFFEDGFGRRATGSVQLSHVDGTCAKVQVLLVKPDTFMNRSGAAVAEVLTDFPIQAADILVIHDDMDISLGKIRFKYEGSSGGHKGVQSIINHLMSNGFPRLKVGIGRPELGTDPADYVLSPFEDRELLFEVVEKAACAALDCIALGISEAMNRHN